MAEAIGKQLGPPGAIRLIKETAKRTDLTKPIFLHALRASRATHCAKNGMNEMVMRKIFGWSPTSQMPAIYIALAGKDTKNAVLEMSGIKSPEKEQPIQPKKCIRCGVVAPVDAVVCKKCFFPLTVEAAMQQSEQGFEKQLEAKLDAMLEKKLDEKLKKNPIINQKN